MTEKLNIQNFYRHPRFWRHAKLWLFIYVLFVINLWLLRSDEEFVARSLEYFSFLILVKLMIYAAFTIFNIHYKRKRYVLISLGIAMIVVLAAFIADHFQVNGITVGLLQGFWANLIVLPMILFVAFGFKLAYHGAKQLFRIQNLESKQLESELKLLRSQVNPHFLFNTLNNIYSTNLSDHDQANEMILGLADLLRYQLESTTDKYVSLEKEITSLKHYIEIEKIRVRDCEVKIHQEGNYESVRIAPLLMLPFIENAFKYGTGIQKGDIAISYTLKEGNLFVFKCFNKIIQEYVRRHSGGIGLNNVKKRLALLYPDRHELKITHSANSYEVNLQIQL